MSEACDPSSALDVAFDASYSRDVTGRGLSFTWSQSGINPLLQDLLDKANAAKASRLVITAASILLLPNGDYTLQVAASNFLGAASSRNITFSKKGAGEAPTVSIVGGQQQDFKLADGIRVSSQLLAKSVCAGKQVRWKGSVWSAARRAAVAAELVLKSRCIGKMSSCRTWRLGSGYMWFAARPYGVSSKPLFSAWQAKHAVLKHDLCCVFLCRWSLSGHLLTRHCPSQTKQPGSRTW